MTSDKKSPVALIYLSHQELSLFTKKHVVLFYRFIKNATTMKSNIQVLTLSNTLKTSFSYFVQTLSEKYPTGGFRPSWTFLDKKVVLAVATGYLQFLGRILDTFQDHQDMGFLSIRICQFQD